MTSVIPERAVGRGRVTLNGSNFDIGDTSEVLLRDTPARISFASSRRLVITIPDEMEGGRAPVLLGATTVGHVSIGSVWATGLHRSIIPFSIARATSSSPTAGRAGRSHRSPSSA